MDVITTVLILMEVIIVLVWMDMNWDQITTLVQVIICMLYYITTYVGVLKVTQLHIINCLRYNSKVILHSCTRHVLA